MQDTDDLNAMLGADVYSRLVSGSPQLWLNERLAPAAQALRRCEVGEHEFWQAAERWDAFRPLLRRCFGSRAPDGRIRSGLRRIAARDHAAVFVKADHELPLAGSIKARGGFYEVLSYARAVGERHGLIDPADDLGSLASEEARRTFAAYTLVVGSTGNLGFSIGVVGRALNFGVQVHMSAQASPWKKRQLRAIGADVIEHCSDYTAAVAAARESASAAARSYFVDDEASRLLLLGYSSAALELHDQLCRENRIVDDCRPLFVYIPCGVGGAPAGIALGLKILFGDSVHCFFVEPTGSPCMLLQLAAGAGRPISVYEVGLANDTVADGLAVATASQLAAAVSSELVSGVITVSDEQMLRSLADATDRLSLRLEPAAAAAFAGAYLFSFAPLAETYFEQRAPYADPRHATHVIWATGGSLMPDEDHARLREAYAAGQRSH